MSDFEQGGLPSRKDQGKRSGIGLPGGKRAVKMPETVREGAMPPRMNNGSGSSSNPSAGLPSRKSVSSGAAGLPGASRREPGEGVLPGGRKSVGEGLPGASGTHAGRANSLPVPSVKSVAPSARDEGVRRSVSQVPVVAPSAPVEPVEVERVPSAESIQDSRMVHGGLREAKRSVSDRSPLAGSESWDDEDVPDTHLGLNAEAPQVKKERKRKPKFSLTKRDIEIITLCSRYRFAYREQIQHYFQSENIRNRLTRLADEGLLRKDMVTQNQALWLPTQAGLDVADMDLTHIDRGRYSATSIAHSVGLLNLGIEFEMGWENLLKEDVWPNANRRDKSGQWVQGETVITEREITNSLNRLKGIAKGDAKKNVDVSQELIRMRTEALSEIPEPGKTPVEMRDGMAGLFVGYFQNKSHTPDMVIARPRAEDGSSQHIAIELELNPKPITDWIRILRTFKADPMFKSVIYFTHKRSINNQLSELNRKYVQLTPEQFRIFKYTPRNDSIPFWG